MDQDCSQFEVGCNRVASPALDDAQATPLMEDVLINPTSQKTRNPDTGCYQSLISENLV